MKEPLREIAEELRRCADALDGALTAAAKSRLRSYWEGVARGKNDAADAPKPVPGVVLTTAVTKDRVVLASVDSIGLSWLPGGLYDDIYVEVWGGQFGGGKDGLRTATAVEVVDACREAGMSCPTPVLHLTATCGEKLEVPVDEVHRAFACRSYDHDGTFCASKTIVRRTGKREVLGWECREPADVVRNMCILCGRNVAPREVGSGE